MLAVDIDQRAIEASTVQSSYICIYLKFTSYVRVFSPLVFVECVSAERECALTGIRGPIDRISGGGGGCSLLTGASSWLWSCRQVGILYFLAFYWLWCANLNLGQVLCVFAVRAI